MQNNARHTADIFMIIHKKVEHLKESNRSIT